ncbi:hypothetical protein [Gloeocapsa sp. PCC 73106]|uniref:hypothetical protein n=1 Tax=Gloeocapsa sp. PCC 73106 TaxID=102232 RepID=UPI0002AC8C9A|nr:hypothetical protein [Gloeocapsa sp. PCC 73106]ELR98705.1 hypothetical protein GLO73106DRAFT_00025430 [Gloeocapsa sp. PCC 73106]
MTNSQEFKTIGGKESQAESDQPVIFGITMTPTVLGIILGLLGIGAFMYMLNTFVKPAIESKKQLAADREQKEIQLQQLKSGELEKQIQELQAQLQREQSLEPQVFSMFSDEKTLDTLLLDVNNFIQANQAQLVTFQPESPNAELITDGSLGSLVNERLKRKRNTVVIIGTFEQTRAIVQDIERLQPLLLIKNFETRVTEPPTYLYQEGKIAIEGETKLTSSFLIDAILPRNPEDIPQPEPEAPATETEEKKK